MNPQSPEARGLELMTQRDAILYTIAHAAPEDQTRAIDALDAWHRARTDVDWAALITAEYGPGKAGRRALAAQAVDNDPIVHRQEKIEEWPAAL